MAVEHPATSAQKEKSFKRSKGEQKDTGIDVTVEINQGGDGNAQKKRKADTLEGEGEISKKERKRLRKLAKEKAENAATQTPLQEDDDVFTKQGKTQKREKSKQQVRRLCLGMSVGIK